MKNTLQDIIQENLPNLARQANIQIEEIQRTPLRYSSRRATPRHIIADSPRLKQRKKNVKGSQKGGQVTYKDYQTNSKTAEILQARRDWGPLCHILKEFSTPHIQPN